MQIKHVSDNGNHGTQYKNTSNSNVEKINLKNLQTNNVNNKQNSNFMTGSQNIFDVVQNNSQYNINDNEINQLNDIDTSHEYEYILCNRQYIINAKESVCNAKTINEETFIEQHSSDFFVTSAGQEDVNFLEYSSPIDETHPFNQADASEMSTINVQHLPRGIVNPNYPGFQHLAHTLQDYNSTNIRSCDHSENDMSDDEVDLSNIDQTLPNDSNNTNGNSMNYILEDDKSTNRDLQKEEMTTERDSRKQIPDLLQTLNENNNNDILVSCTTTDIENNFNTSDIIGDFNKEVEDEIRHLLNYNINIEDDLEELRKDIKDTFAKPIENTINNISDVVNDVIKKLVENDCCDKNESISEKVDLTSNLADDNDMKKENETNARTELNISRPTFLLLDDRSNNKITDAILSNGREEINVTEYNTEQLSYNVENTIKQLSTELRKIIPKLNEMREREKLWNDCRKDISTIKDRNSNNILQNSNGPIKLYENSTWHKKQNNLSEHLPVVKKSVKTRHETKSRQSSAKNMSKIKTSVSVQREDYEFESFDVYNIETALPNLDFDAIEYHIKAAKEAERRKRNDREEIRKRLAMDLETEDYYSLGHTDRPGRKPSLHSRLQNGKNLQICFMNETASDNESQASETERNLSSLSLSQTSLLSKSIYNNPYHTRPLSVNITKTTKTSNAQIGSKLRPSSLQLKTSKSKSTHSLNNIELKESDFFALQATLQTEARIALAQAKEMARIQMERERAMRGSSPVTEMLRAAAGLARVPLAPPRRRLSRRLLTDVNVAQLQIIVNELHSQIESLNDTLVKLLMARDELHMGQDSMLVDIEDLTRYLGVKEQTKKIKGTNIKSGVRRLTSLVHK